MRAYTSLALVKCYIVVLHGEILLHTLSTILRERIFPPFTPPRAHISTISHTHFRIYIIAELENVHFLLCAEMTDRARAMTVPYAPCEKLLLLYIYSIIAAHSWGRSRINRAIIRYKAIIQQQHFFFVGNFFSLVL